MRNHFGFHLWALNATICFTVWMTFLDSHLIKSTIPFENELSIVSSNAHYLLILKNWRLRVKRHLKWALEFEIFMRHSDGGGGGSGTLQNGSALAVPMRCCAILWITNAPTVVIKLICKLHMYKQIDVVRRRRRRRRMPSNTSTHRIAHPISSSWHAYWRNRTFLVPFATL